MDEVVSELLFWIIVLTIFSLIGLYYWIHEFKKRNKEIGKEIMEFNAHISQNRVAGKTVQYCKHCNEKIRYNHIYSTWVRLIMLDHENSWTCTINEHHEPR